MNSSPPLSSRWSEQREENGNLFTLDLHPLCLGWWLCWFRFGWLCGFFLYSVSLLLSINCLLMNLPFFSLFGSIMSSYKFSCTNIIMLHRVFRAVLAHRVSFPKYGHKSDQTSSDRSFKKKIQVWENKFTLLIRESPGNWELAQVSHGPCSIRWRRPRARPERSC